MLILMKFFLTANKMSEDNSDVKTDVTIYDSVKLTGLEQVVRRTTATLRR